MNEELFDQLRKLELPVGHYAITASGPLGIRGIRQIGDIDLVVDDELWHTLSKKYPVIEGDFTKIKISNDIEVLGTGSLFDPVTGPTISDQIREAEIIDGLPFVNLNHILYFKKLMNRPKDQDDIIAIEKILKN